MPTQLLFPETTHCIPVYSWELQLIFGMPFYTLSSVYSHSHFASCFRPATSCAYHVVADHPTGSAMSHSKDRVSLFTSFELMPHAKRVGLKFHYGDYEEDSPFSLHPRTSVSIITRFRESRDIPVLTIGRPLAYVYILVISLSTFTPQLFSCTLHQLRPDDVSRLNSLHPASPPDSSPRVIINKSSVFRFNRCYRIDLSFQVLSGFSATLQNRNYQKLGTKSATQSSPIIRHPDRLVSTILSFSSTSRNENPEE